MKSFINAQDLGPLDKALAEAFEIKQDRFKYQHLGKNKTLMMIFFNNSLRTRLSTQKAAMNLGMNVIGLPLAPYGCKNGVAVLMHLTQGVDVRNLEPLHNNYKNATTPI